MRHPCLGLLILLGCNEGRITLARSPTSALVAEAEALCDGAGNADLPDAEAAVQRLYAWPEVAWLNLERPRYSNLVYRVEEESGLPDCFSVERGESIDRYIADGTCHLGNLGDDPELGGDVTWAGGLLVEEQPDGGSWTFDDLEVTAGGLTERLDGWMLFDPTGDRVDGYTQIRIDLSEGGEGAGLSESFQGAVGEFSYEWSSTSSGSFRVLGRGHLEVAPNAPTGTACFASESPHHVVVGRQVVSLEYLHAEGCYDVTIDGEPQGAWCL